MSLINVTPSTGRKTPIHMNLNRLRLKPGARVVYWSPAGNAWKIDLIDAYADQTGNAFTIDGEPVFVGNIKARIPDRFGDAECAAVIADFAALGRSTISTFERIEICDRHGLAS